MLSFYRHTQYTADKITWMTRNIFYYNVKRTQLKIFASCRVIKCNILYGNINRTLSDMKEKIWVGLRATDDIWRWRGRINSTLSETSADLWLTGRPGSADDDLCAYTHYTADNKLQAAPCTSHHLQLDYFCERLI